MTPTTKPTVKIVDFGPAFGQTGPDSFTDLALVLESDFYLGEPPPAGPGSIHIEVSFDVNAFGFQNCASDGPNVQITTSNPSVSPVIIDVVAADGSGDLVLSKGNFMTCKFQVTDGAGFFPVSLVGTFTDHVGATTAVSATGGFQIFCADDSGCTPPQICDGTGTCVPP